MLRLLQHPVLLVLLCFSLIGTPVTYRGGATNPHPHMFLEFLMDAEAGSFDHHHHGGGDEADEPDSHSHHTEHDSTPVQEPNATQQAEAAEQFGPSLSAFVVSDVGQLAFILPEHALPQASQIQTAFLRAGDAASGITHSPIAPPPR